MKNFLIVADQGRGKTHFVIENILKPFHDRPNYIMDRNLEYDGFKNSAKNFWDRDEFLKEIPLGTKHNPSNVNAIFEEATGFIPKQGNIPLDIGKHIFTRFHTGNINAFNFHGLNFVNKDILPSIDFFVIFRTSDRLDQLEKKFGDSVLGREIIEAWEDVMKKTEGTAFDRKNKVYLATSTRTAEYSKNFYHYKRIVAKEK